MSTLFSRQDGKKEGGEGGRQINGSDWYSSMGAQLVLSAHALAHYGISMGVNGGRVEQLVDKRYCEVYKYTFERPPLAKDCNYTLLGTWTTKTTTIPRYRTTPASCKPSLVL